MTTSDRVRLAFFTITITMAIPTHGQHHVKTQHPRAAPVMQLQRGLLHASHSRRSTCLPVLTLTQNPHARRLARYACSERYDSGVRWSRPAR